MSLKSPPPMPPPPVNGAHALAPSTSAQGQGVKSPASSSSRRSSSGRLPPSFDSSLLSPFLRALLQARLKAAAWDQARAKALGESIARDVKQKMIEIQPKGFKYLVIAQIVEQRGQGGSSHMACLWDAESDIVAREAYENDVLICTVVCFALRASY